VARQSAFSPAASFFLASHCWAVVGFGGGGGGAAIAPLHHHSTMATATAHPLVRNSRIWVLRVRAMGSLPRGRLKGKTPDYAKCEEKFAKAFAKAEQEAGPGGCPTEGDAAAIEGRVDVCMAGVAGALTGAPCDPICGCGYNGVPDTNCLGCTFCLQAGAGPVPNCQFFCLAPPTCTCPPGDAACCAANPCCDNCADPKPAECFVNTCSCDPGTCCFTVRP
jgi:hypothetical protein